MNEPTYAIQTLELTKRYRKHLAVDHLNLQVPTGSVYAFLGRNGAGKTTTIRMLLNLLDRSSGGVSVLGLDPQRRDFELKKRIGYVAEGQRMYDWMSVAQIVWFCKGFYPTWDDALAADLTRQMELPAKQKLRNLSRGTQAKVALLLAMAHRPELLILDEPTAGLDVVVRREFLEGVIDMIQQEGRTVFFSSHIVHEVERVADWVGVLDEGRLIWSGPLDDLKRSVKRLVLTFPDSVPQSLSLDGALSTRISGRQATIVVRNHSEAVLQSAHRIAPQVDVEDLPLEDVLVALLGEGGGR
ncbi:MAG TPA: ABC transporter ATP-binding protein [Armatimonadota bacterium]|jgi:ABC-2 type transport system ATP-binding protein